MAKRRYPYKSPFRRVRCDNCHELFLPNELSPHTHFCKECIQDDIDAMNEDLSLYNFNHGPNYMGGER